MLNSISMTAFSITLCCLSAAFLLDKLTEAPIHMPNVPKPRPAATASLSMNQVTVDYTPTASVPTSFAQPIVLVPCTGARR